MNVENWLLLLTSLATLVWPAIAFGAYAAYRRCKSLQPEPHPDPDPAHHARVSVIIPARNEERDIEASLRSVLGQQGVQLQVIVINDHSSDGTAAILNRLAAEDPRIKPLHDPPMTDGWLGKANAMQYASQHATGDFIIFTDADIQHEQGSFAAAVAEMQEGGHALLSLMPLFHWVSIWENAAAPAFLLAMTNYLSGAIHDPESDDALAIGAFIMVDAETYRSVGGHEAVRNEMLDDVMLARHFKRSGHPVAFRVAPQCLSVRMYEGRAAVFYGSIKNSLAIFGENFWLACPLSATFLLGGVSVLYSPIYALFVGNWTLLALGLLVYAEVVGAVLLSRAYMKCNLLKLAGFIVGVPVLVSASVVAIYQAAFFGSVLWRGRAIRVSE